MSDTLLGLLVEEVEDTQEHSVFNYYFVGIVDNELRSLRYNQGQLAELFNTRPVFFLRQKIDKTGSNDVCNWTEQSSINPMYRINEEATLC